ncbi:hypothetical protein C8R46DRAFT_93707 [Mycena filopes]|nr:hypothetical protein C8R46DRAFT_93707 [Mycena filopes]
MATNYAQIIGIQSKWAPILFAVIYFLVMIWYSVQAVRRHGWVFGFLAFFSLLRVISFSLRAAIASNHHNAAFNRNMVIAYEIIYNIGFFSILLSAHRLLNDRRRLAKIDRGQSRLHRSMGRVHKGRFIELLLLTSVILGIIGVAFALGSKAGRTATGGKLTQASTYIFLVVTVFILLLTFLGIHIERALRKKITHAGNGSAAPGAGTAPAHSALNGAKNYHHLILLLISLLLLLRILFYAATIHQRATGQATTTQRAKAALANEHLWYPLAALAELLVVLLFLTPALVPVRALVNRHRRNVNANGHPNEKTGAGYNAGDTAATGGLGAHDGVGAV